MQKDKTTTGGKTGGKTGTMPTKMRDLKQHKTMHPEREIPSTEPDNRAEILPSTHIDDDPESYRLT